MTDLLVLHRSMAEGSTGRSLALIISLSSANEAAQSSSKPCANWCILNAKYTDDVRYRCALTVSSSPPCSCRVCASATDACICAFACK